MTNMNTFERGMTNLLLAQLAELYFSENQLLHGLDGMAKATTSPELEEVFRSHRKVTEVQITRLEAMFGKLGEKPHAFPSGAVQGLLDDGLRIIRTEGPTKFGYGTYSRCAKVEMLEIASYRSVIRLASKLGHDDIAEMCELTLEEEKEADDKLSELGDASQFMDQRGSSD